MRGAISAFLVSVVLSGCSLQFTDSKASGDSTGGSGASSASSSSGATGSGSTGSTTATSSSGSSTAGSSGSGSSSGSSGALTPVLLNDANHTWTSLDAAPASSLSQGVVVVGTVDAGAGTWQSAYVLAWPDGGTSGQAVDFSGEAGTPTDVLSLASTDTSVFPFATLFSDQTVRFEPGGVAFDMSQQPISDLARLDPTGATNDVGYVVPESGMRLLDIMRVSALAGPSVDSTVEEPSGGAAHAELVRTINDAGTAVSAVLETDSTGANPVVLPPGQSQQPICLPQASVSFEPTWLAVDAQGDVQVAGYRSLADGGIEASIGNCGKAAMTMTVRPFAQDADGKALLLVLYRGTRTAYVYSDTEERFFLRLVASGESHDLDLGLLQGNEPPLLDVTFDDDGAWLLNQTGLYRWTPL